VGPISENWTSSELKDLESSIARAVLQAQTLEDLTIWLQAQPDVEAARLEDHQLKTYPPRREITVWLKSEGNTVRRMVVVLQVADADGLQLVNMRRLD
jgi:hypothetical protein